MARRPRNLEKIKAIGPLGDASIRLQMLQRAGLSPERRADLLRNFIEVAEATMNSAMSVLNKDVPDYHARMSAGWKLMTLIGATPGKGSSSGEGDGKQVAVTINLPDWAAPLAQPREPKQVGASSTPSAGQPRVITD